LVNKKNSDHNFTLLGYFEPGSSVAIANGYRLDGPVIDLGGDEIFSTCPGRPWVPPNLLYNRYRVFPGGKKGPKRDADSSSSSSGVVKKEQGYASTPPMGLTACTEPQCLYSRAIHLFPYGPYGL